MSKMAPGAGERKLLSEKLQQLSADLDLANVKIESLESRLVALEVQARMELGQYKSAVLDPGERGFSRLDTSLGSFVVSLQDVTPYADGVRVRLNVGNLTTAMVKGGTFRVKWGPRKPPLRGEDYALRYSEWTKALREKSIEFQDDLRSGAWNSVTLSLVGLPPAQFGYLELSMETPTISLLQPR
jgi:hypothetical protein